MPEHAENPKSWQNVSIKFCETLLVLTLAVCAVLRGFRVLVEFCRFRRAVSPTANGKHRQDAARELESGIAASSSAILPTPSDIRGAPAESGVVGNSRPGTNDSCRQSASFAGTGLIAMPTTTLKPDTNLRLRYRVPKGRIVEFDVEADRPVKTYIMREGGLALFDKGEPFRYYGGFQDPPKKNHHQELVLPFDGRWFLLIMNPSKSNPVEVTYEVSF